MGIGMIIHIKHKVFFRIIILIIVIEIFILTIKIVGIDNVADFLGGEENVAVPILLYHSVLRSDMIIDRYGITPGELECDLKYIRDNGYTTITMSELIDFVCKDAPLPAKPVILTFDDGYYNNYKYVYPLLKKYEMKAVMAIIGCYTDLFTRENSDNLVYAHINWKQVNDMIQSGLVEIQNHSYSLHTTKKGRVGAQMKSGESKESYMKVLENDIGRFQNIIAEQTGVLPNTFVYPFGAISKESVEILKSLGFCATLSSYGGVNYIKRDPDKLFGLKRNNRLRGISSYEFFRKIYKR